MKKLLKVLLPPSVGFAIYFLIIRYSSFYFSLRPDEMGAGNLFSFMAFYRYLLPLLFTVAVLTQLLIAVPMWNNAKERSTAGKIWTAAFVLIIFLIFAGGIGYIIWDKDTGVHHLLVLCSFLAAVQLVYWIVNLLILKLLDRG